jgi:hypothetical protein
MVRHDSLDEGLGFLKHGLTVRFTRPANGVARASQEEHQELADDTKRETERAKMNRFHRR